MTWMPRNAAAVALCTERFTSSGPLAAPDRRGNWPPTSCASTQRGHRRCRRQRAVSSCGLRASGPLDVNRSVQSATAAALRGIQVIHRAVRAEGAP